MNQLKEMTEAIEKEIKRKKASESLLDYNCYVNDTYVKSKFHTYLCNTVQKFMETKNSHSFDILLLSVPPQHGKSISITETLPAWWLGKHPNEKWIIASYNTEFAQTFGRRNRQKCETYNPEVFPGFKLADNPCNNIEFETVVGGGVYSAGILGGITGHPAHNIIIDDPIKTRGEADSQTTKDNIWDEYLSSVRTRLKPGGKLILIQTRWVEDDLFGRIAEEEPKAQIINLPCECEDPKTDPLGRNKGDALCPEIGRDNEWLRDFKRVYQTEKGSLAWTSLYQGRPSLLEGNIIKKEWWRYYSLGDLPQVIPYKIVSVDAAFKDGEDNDFVCIQKWGKCDNKMFMLENIKEHLSFVETVDVIRNLKAQDPSILYILIEDKANGTAVINVLSSEMEGVIPVKPEGGKVTRANAVTPAIESGRVWLPKYASFTKDFVRECSSFPNAAHDDQVDAMTQALNRMIYIDADVVNPIYTLYSDWTDDMWEDYTGADEELQQELIKKWGAPREWIDD